MPWPWTRSFSAPSDLGLPKYGIELQMVKMQELYPLAVNQYMEETLEWLSRQYDVNNLKEKER